MRSGWGRAASWVLLFWDRFSVSKLLSQIQRSTLWLLQGLSQRPSFGGFGLRELFVWMAMFQSSSGQNAGCNVRAIATVPPIASFQSSSGQKAGCNRLAVVHAVAPQPISILIQPEGRMQLPCCIRYCAADNCFNPHPARRPDATRTSCESREGITSFNPHPARRPDATRTSCESREGITSFNPHPARRPDATAKPGLTGLCYRLCYAGVSILIQPEGRMQLPPARWGPGTPCCFNPHPARRPDATWRESGARPQRTTCFNPHPPRRPDATLQSSCSGTGPPTPPP